MPRTVALGLVLLTSVLTLGCSGMMAEWRARNCHYNGAYKAGMNHARAGKRMRMDFSDPCDAKDRPEAERGYREGYTAGVGAAPAAARGPAWHCETAYGKKRCGYRCIKAHGQIACTQQAHHNCVKGYGDVKCGNNCRTERGNIICDE